LAHVAAVCRSGYYQLWQLRQAVQWLSEDANKTLVPGFVYCRLDYCNSLFFAISEGLTSRLQSIQNAAAWLVTGTSRCYHIMTVLCLLHWLLVLVCQQVNFNVATLVHRLLSGNLLSYLADNCRLTDDVHEQQLRSTVHGEPSTCHYTDPLKLW